MLVDFDGCQWESYVRLFICRNNGCVSSKWVIARNLSVSGPVWACTEHALSLGGGHDKCVVDQNHMWSNNSQKGNIR